MKLTLNVIFFYISSVYVCSLVLFLLTRTHSQSDKIYRQTSKSDKIK